MRATPREALLALTAVALVAGLVASAPAEAGPRTADAVPAAPAPIVLSVLDADLAAAPTAAGVQARLGRLTDSLRAASIVVIDPESGQVLLDEEGSRPRIPASTAKLATAAASLVVLGPQTRLATTVARTGRVLYLVGGGDPTLVRAKGGNALAGGSASLRELAVATVRGFEANTRIRLVYDATAFEGPILGPGWSRSFPNSGVAAPVTALVVDGGRVRPGATSRVADPARQAAEVFAGYLRSFGIEVRSIRPGRAPSDASTIATVESPPIEDIVQRMLTESDNNYAEALGHLVGGTTLGEPTFAGGAEATRQALDSIDVDTTGMALVDASGLSGRNQMPARVLAEVLADVASGARPELGVITPGLAVAGLTGTLADRFDTTATRAGRGFVQAKTGTLTGVSSLAGTVLTQDGRLLVFAVIANRVGSLAAARESIDRIASRLATCGCP